MCMGAREGEREGVGASGAGRLNEESQMRLKATGKLAQLTAHLPYVYDMVKHRHRACVKAPLFLNRSRRP